MYPRTYYNDPSANTYTGRPSNMMSLTKGTTSESFSTKYRLRMYVDESYNPQGDGGDLTFSVKINAYGKTGDVMPKSTVAQTLLSNGLGVKGSFDTSDSEQTFITGENPNNYIWYSGKLWRAVSIDPTDNSVKLVTQWGISSLAYNQANNSDFKGSYMEQWLNDTSVDGFLGNLREPEKFIKTDSVWNATMTTETTKPEKTTLVTDAVGLLNIYEYTMSYNNATSATGYLCNSSLWLTLTPYSNSEIYAVSHKSFSQTVTNSDIARPVINLKSSIKIISGSGTSDNPYRLEGDADTLTTGTLLSTRYSGEYISFGTGENNLYRIVSHENGEGTKITSAAPLKDSSGYKKLAFGTGQTFSKDNTIGTFLNGDYLAGDTYLTSDQLNMIEDDTTWYLGTVGSEANYKLAKYQDATSSSLTTTTTTAKVGLLRYGELMTAQFDNYANSIDYWIITSPPANKYNTVRYISQVGMCAAVTSTVAMGVKPAMNLKSNVVIISGDGTKNNPFQIKLGS